MKPELVVSVILPAYNRRDLVCRALASVLDQSVREMEVLVVDDGSTDGTGDAVASLGDSRVRLIRLDANRGQSAARNRGVREAIAPLIAFQDSDDEWKPEKLARQIELLSRRLDTAMVYGDLLRVPRQGESFVLHAPDLVRGRVMDHRGSGYAAYGLGIQTCLFRTETFRRVGGFNERMFCFEDLEFFLRFNQRFASVRIPEALVRYHETDGVSKVTDREYEARKHLLRRFWWPILRQRPSWFQQERENIMNRRRLDQ